MIKKKPLLTTTAVIACNVCVCVVPTDARPQTPTPTVPGRRQLRVPVYGELLRAARAPVAPPAAAVPAPGPGPAYIVVLAGGRVPAARFAQSAPPASASRRGRRGRGRPKGFRVRVRAAVQMLQAGRQQQDARRRRAATSPAAPAPAPAATAGFTTAIDAAVVPVSAQEESVLAGQHVRVAAVRRRGRQHASTRGQGRVFGQGHAQFGSSVRGGQDDQK